MKAKVSKRLLTALWVLGVLLLTLVMVGVLLLGSVPALSGTNPSDGRSLAEARQALEQQIKSTPGFVGIAHSEVRGEIVIFLENEQAKGIVSSRFEGHSVRTEVTGRFHALSTQVAESIAPSQVAQVSFDRKGIVRPLMGGTSASAYVANEFWAGTLGMVTYDNKILSNAHVIAMDGSNFLPVGTPIIQPGMCDGGTLLDRVGKLEQYIPIEFWGPKNYADAAIASIDAGIEASPGEQFDEAGNYWIAEWTEVSVGDIVRKSGRTTGITTGEVANTNYAGWVLHGDRLAYFADQIVVDGPFSAMGDSGSAVDKNGEFVGLVHAGNDDYSIVCKASYIIEGLGIAVEPTEVEQPDITVDPTGLEMTLPPDTTQDYILTIGNIGDAALTYHVSVQQATGGTGTAQAERLFSVERARRILEAPLESSQAEPQYSGHTQGGWQTIMTDDFEGPWPGVWTTWVAPGATDAYWGKDGYRSYTGSYSAFCAKSGEAGVNPPSNYLNNMYAWMIYGPFSLEDATAAELNFWFWADTEPDCDWLHWMASVDDYHYYGRSFSRDSGGWVNESFDLTNVDTLGNLCGEPEVWIAFIFESDASITYQGAFVDEVVLRKYVADGVNNPPHTPSNPSPANHATHVSIDANLSWTGGDPDADDTVTYDVHFGTSSPPPFKEAIGLYPATETSLTYELDPLDYNTICYWKIVATDSQGASTTGPVWEFTAGGPDCAWLDVEPGSGSVAPGESDELTVTIGTSGLDPGDYSAEIVIANNDADKDPVVLPVTLHVSDVTPTVTTQDASGIGVDAATLNMSYTVGGHSSVSVRFAYKKAADSAWTKTLWVSKSASGTHAEPLSGLNTHTLYDFRGELKYDSTEIRGAALQFTTGSASEEATAEATRSIDPQTIVPGETVQVTVEFDSLLGHTEGFGLVEEIPEGWLFESVDNAGADFVKVDGTIEWLWLTLEAGATKAVVYTLTAPDDADEADYPIDGVVKAAGVDNPVLGDDTITVGEQPWYHDWTEDGVIGDEAILEAVSCWLTGRRKNDHVLTDEDILWLVACWLTGEVTLYPY